MVEAFITERVNDTGKKLRKLERSPDKHKYQIYKKKLEFTLDTYSNVLLLIAQERAIINETK